jgi:hypothetical protein
MSPLTPVVNFVACSLPVGLQVIYKNGSVEPLIYKISPCVGILCVIVPIIYKFDRIINNLLTH